jgi:hypothetical protein
VLIEKEYTLEEAKIMMMIIGKIEETMQEIRVESGDQHVITYSLKKGIKKFGDPAREAAQKEMKQMVDRRCFDPTSKAGLNEVERRVINISQ